MSTTLRRALLLCRDGKGGYYRQHLSVTRLQRVYGIASPGFASTFALSLITLLVTFRGLLRSSSSDAAANGSCANSPRAQDEQTMPSGSPERRPRPTDPICNR